MQTFLPYPDFNQSAAVLDYQRLGKQRSEAMIILKTLTGEYGREGKKGWPHHPATKMWRGCEVALARYGLAICVEWQRRGYAGEDTQAWFERRIEGISVNPTWLGDEDFHRSHRSNLLRKHPVHYVVHWPGERPDLPYIWPV